MNLSQYIGVLKNDPGFMANVTCWKELPARPARNVTGAAIRSAPGAADYKPLCLPDARFQTA